MSWIITVTATLAIFMAFITASSMMQKRNILFSIDSTDTIIKYYSIILDHLRLQSKYVPGKKANCTF